MSYKSHHHKYIMQCMKENVSAQSITHKEPKATNHKLPLDVTLPLDLTYSIPLPLWRQAPKPKGRTAGQEQSSRALRCSEKSRTEQHHPLTLSSERSDPLSLEVEVKWSGSAQEPAWSMTLEVSK